MMLLSGVASSGETFTASWSLARQCSVNVPMGPPICLFRYVVPIGATPSMKFRPGKPPRGTQVVIAQSALLQVGDVPAHMGHHADAFVAEHAGAVRLGNQVQLVDLRGADAAGRLLDDDLIGTGIRNVDLVDEQRRAGGGHDRGS